MEGYVCALSGAGFELTALRECAPEPGRFDGDPADFHGVNGRLAREGEPVFE